MFICPLAFSWFPGHVKMSVFFFSSKICIILAPRGVVSQMMKDPLSLIEDKTLANEVHQVPVNNNQKTDIISY